MRVFLLLLMVFISSACEIDNPSIRQVNCSFGGYKKISIKYPVKYLYFTNNNVTTLEVLKNVNVTGHLIISYNNIVDLEELNKMSGLFGLIQFIADYNKITKVSDLAFNNFPNLTFLSLTSNNIYSIDTDSFKFTNKLKWIYLENNFIKSVEFLYNLKEFRTYVNLSNNSIEDLNNMHQLNLTPFKKLDISFNKIEYIDNVALIILNTTIVDLSGNNFCCHTYKNIKNGSFSNLIIDKNMNESCNNCTANLLNNTRGLEVETSSDFVILHLLGIFFVICLMSSMLVFISRHIWQHVNRNSVVQISTQLISTTSKVVENDCYKTPEGCEEIPHESPVLPDCDDDGYLRPNEPIYEEIKDC